MFYTPLQTDDKRLLRRQERLERHARDLREMAAVGMDLVRTANNQAFLAESGPGVLGEISLSFARVSRAVRQTMALETDVEEAIINLENPVQEQQRQSQPHQDQPQAPREQAAEPLTPQQLTSQIKAILGGGIVANAPKERREDLLGDLDDYLDDDRLQADFDGLTVSEIITRIARDLRFDRDSLANAKANADGEAEPISPFCVTQAHSPLAALARIGQHPMPRTLEAAWGLPRDG